MSSPIIKYFKFDHLPEHLQTVSKPVGELAEMVDRNLPDGPEKEAGLRKLLEAKDCFVRAAIVSVDPDKESIVYSDPECTFNYCPNPEVCKGDGCQHKSKSTS